MGSYLLEVTKFLQAIERLLPFPPSHRYSGHLCTPTGVPSSLLEMLPVVFAFNFTSLVFTECFTKTYAHVSTTRYALKDTII